MKDRCRVPTGVAGERRAVLRTLGGALVGVGVGAVADAWRSAPLAATPLDVAPAVRTPDAAVIASRRGERLYEDWRQSMIWQRRKAARFPEAIAQVSTVEEVAAAVRYARQAGLRIATRCGGHSMSACFLRDRGLLLDVSRLQSLAIDVAGRTVSIGPGVLARTLSERLREVGLAFPTAHCGMVPLGGFLLGGGLGLNGNHWGGMGAFNIESAQVVTADGVVREVSATQHPELFWAIRGGGPGLFLVVTELRLRAYPLPAAIVGNTLAFPFSRLREVATALAEIGPRTSSQVELLGYAGTAPDDLQPLLSPVDGGRAMFLHANAFADSLAHSRRLRQPLFEHPIVRHAVWRAVDHQRTLEELYAEEELGFSQRRWTGDNVFTNRLAEVCEVLGRRIVECPARDAQAVFLYKGSLSMPDAACSTIGDFYAAFYSLWDEPGEDERNLHYLVDLYREIAPLGTGSNINEMNQEGRPEAIPDCYSPGAWRRLAELRTQWDPDGLFHDFYARS